MPDYQKTQIYKLFHKEDVDNKNIYIGHTTQIHSRLYNHGRNCYNDKVKEYNYKLYKYIRENGGWNEWKYEIIEDYPCKDIYEASVREGYWKLQTNSTLNDKVPGRDNKQYYIDNKEHIDKQNRENYYKNIEQRRDYQKNCDKTKKKEQEKSKVKCPLCDLEVTRYKLKRHQESRNCKNIVQVEKDEEQKELQRIKNNEYYNRRYYEKRDEILAKDKVRYEANKDIINVKRRNADKLKINCDHCGILISKINISTHKKTQKCKNNCMIIK